MFKNDAEKFRKKRENCRNLEVLIYVLDAKKLYKKSLKKAKKERLYCEEDKTLFRLEMTSFDTWKIETKIGSIIQLEIVEDVKDILVEMFEDKGFVVTYVAGNYLIKF